jgi:hypothetical protein
LFRFLRFEAKEQISYAKRKGNNEERSQKSEAKRNEAIEKRETKPENQSETVVNGSLCFDKTSETQPTWISFRFEAKKKLEAKPAHPTLHVGTRQGWQLYVS